MEYPKIEYPKESGRMCICTLDNGEVIESIYVICPALGIAYFKEIVNTGRFVVDWRYK